MALPPLLPLRSHLRLPAPLRRSPSTPLWRRCSRAVAPGAAHTSPSLGCKCGKQRCGRGDAGTSGDPAKGGAGEAQTAAAAELKDAIFTPWRMPGSLADGLPGGCQAKAEQPALNQAYGSPSAGFWPCSSTNANKANV